jgi:sterol desaturase/sphingolipid hydroxylase (fatty acid hydroxylase superfamily)
MTGEESRILFWSIEAFGFVKTNLADNALFINTLLVTIPIVLFLEKIIPIDPAQKSFGANVVQDMIWLVIITLFKFTVLVWFVFFLESFYTQHLSFLTLHGISVLPKPAQILIGFLLVDFLDWLHHLIRHKVPWFWYFHTIHHSQRRMNMFTDFRFHVVEFLIAEPINLFPMFVLAFEPPEAVTFLVFHMFFTRFYHANIRTNLGWLRYILVTPQSHRVHHSIESEHRDKNFGVIFSIWDHLFGTQLREYDVYPDTGVEDAAFPMEPRAVGLNLIYSTLSQLIYPFRVIGRGLVLTFSHIGVFHRRQRNSV